MAPDVLALVRTAERDLRALLAELDQRGDWEARTRSLLTLQSIAATLVDAARRHAEDLSREAGRHGRDRPRD